jgi:hypothetical protein
MDNVTASVATNGLDWQTILWIVTGIWAVVSSVGMARLGSKIKSFWANLLDVKNTYKAAVADGIITTEEKARIADELIEAVNDGADLYLTGDDMVRRILPLLKRRV